MNEELREVAERAICGFEGYDHPQETRSPFVDLVLLGRHVLAELDARERQAAEDALPVDEAWLRSVGFKDRDWDGYCLSWRSPLSSYIELIWIKKGSWLTAAKE